MIIIECDVLHVFPVGKEFLLFFVGGKRVVGTITTLIIGKHEQRTVAIGVFRIEIGVVVGVSLPDMEGDALSGFCLQRDGGLALVAFGCLVVDGIVLEVKHQVIASCGEDRQASFLIDDILERREVVVH